MKTLLAGKLNNTEILLASHSPRRRELLAQLDIPFVVPELPQVNETYPSHLDGAEIPQYITRVKATAYRSHLQPQQLLITADTIVYLPSSSEQQRGQVLGKPSNADDAASMLRLLSGREHQVITAVTLTTSQRQTTFAETSLVCFKPLIDSEIDYYIHNYAPFDKAGAYGIQEWIGHIGVTRLMGSYTNVMGLPTHRLYSELLSFLKIEK